METLTSFLYSVTRGTARPRYSWSVEEDGAIRVSTTDAPAGALDKLHRAYLTEQKNALGRGLLAAGVWDGLEQTSS